MNITIYIPDEDTHKIYKEVAASQGISLSKLIQDIIVEIYERNKQKKGTLEELKSIAPDEVEVMAQPSQNTERYLREFCVILALTDREKELLFEKFGIKKKK